MLKKTYYRMGAAIITGALMTNAGAAFAEDADTSTDTGGDTGNNFGAIARNINDSIADVPGLLTGISYMMGILLAVLGILKIKDHVENPTQTALKDGAIRLATGGALFSLPIIFEAMSNTVGNEDVLVTAAEVNRITFALSGDE